ncbi:hypothetical protein [Pseudoxanthomonas sp. 10H]|uniref:hypothetical protein n=1 Tax=Pseudoxanthomonas sp. 10H TaxID=3242729 RepID=UPI003558A3BE
MSRVAAAGLLLAGLGGAGAATVTTPVPTPVRVDLWLSPPPVDGNLQRCAEEAGDGWTRARAGALMRRMGDDVRVEELGPQAGAGVAWTQRCFELRQGGRVLARGAVVPAASARHLRPPLWVLVFEHRARRHPDMTLGCGFPAPPGGRFAGCGRWPPEDAAGPELPAPDTRARVRPQAIK